MDAQILNLEQARSARNIRTIMGAFFLMPIITGGLGLQRSATSWWVEYAHAMASFHALLILAACSTGLNKPSLTEAQPHFRY